MLKIKMNAAPKINESDSTINSEESAPYSSSDADIYASCSLEP